MGESGAGAPDDGGGEGPAAPNSAVKADADARTHTNGAAHPTPVSIAPHGDLVLDVTFETSPETLRRSRKAALAAARRAGAAAASASGMAAATTADLQPTIRAAYRVSLAKLKQHSKYFSSLLSNPQFREAQAVVDAHAALSSRSRAPADADPADLPWIAVTDDDEATGAAGRDRRRAIEDMLRIIHGQPPTSASTASTATAAASPATPGRAASSPAVTMAYVTTLAITADRFDCAASIARCVTHDLRFKWPVTAGRPIRDDAGRPTDVEQLLRQKILVAWLLGQPIRLHHATRELISRGSGLWSVFHETPAAENSAAWWNLPDGLERECSGPPPSLMHPPLWP
jgi:hypothetical protein